MRRILTLALAAAIAATASTAKALAASGATVNAKVTVAAPCLTVSPAALDFGTFRFPTSPTDVSGGNASQQTILTNCGSGPESVFARATDAHSTTSAAAWQLIAISPWAQGAGPNMYNLALLEFGRPFAFWLTTTDALWGTVAGSATSTISTSITMPRAGSDGAGETMTMQIVYTAAF